MTSNMIETRFEVLVISLFLKILTNNAFTTLSIVLSFQLPHFLNSFIFCAKNTTLSTANHGLRFYLP